jgi:hypothetical protein
VQAESVHILKILEAIVRGAPGAPGLKGAISVGVQDREGVSWTKFAFGSSAIITAGCADPSNSDAALLLTGDEARRLLDPEARDPSSDLGVYGDKDLLLRFLRRYFGYESPLGLRSAEAKRRSP